MTYSCSSPCWQPHFICSHSLVVGPQHSWWETGSCLEILNIKLLHTCDCWHMSFNTLWPQQKDCHLGHIFKYIFSMPLWNAYNLRENLQKHTSSRISLMKVVLDCGRYILTSCLYKFYPQHSGLWLLPYWGWQDNGSGTSAPMATNTIKPLI